MADQSATEENSQMSDMVAAAAKEQIGRTRLPYPDF